MKDKFFIDTNIFVYSFDRSPKKEKAMELIKAAFTSKGCISYQVIQEFINVACRKFEMPFKYSDLQLYVTRIMFPLCEVFPSENLYMNALEISEKWKFSFYDSLIIASALESKCSFLYSEDLQHGQKIREVKIINPFL